MLIRLLHTQSTDGPLLVTDIESGLPNERFGIYRKQPGVYVPYYRTYFNQDGLVEVDRDTAGFVDLVPSDKAVASLDRGVIAKFVEKGFVTATEIPSGALNAPVVTEAEQTGTGDVTVTGANFVSFAPDTTRVQVAGVELDGTDFIVDSATQIRITTGVAYDAGQEVVVIANSQESNAQAVAHTPA